jgi:hypothetical protein
VPSSTVNHAIDRVSRRVPGLRRLPMLRLLALAEVVLLAQQHIERLTPAERRRVVQLVRLGRGRTGNLSERERTELSGLVHKAEPRTFVAEAVQKVSPVPIPGPVVHRLVAERRSGTRH